jgi:4-hydroxybenzoate polyprenyltransferase
MRVVPTKIRAYLELVRIPNLFTAMADVGMGFLFTHATHTPGDGWRLALLVAASSAFYAGGVVLNDVFDFETDRRERPKRPLPSGRISLAAARWLGWELLLVGLLLAWTAAYLSRTMGPGVVGSALVCCILLYDGPLKQTPLGPIVMGACRFFNVLLGMSALAAPWQIAQWVVAGAIGTYVAGIAWFARTEAETSNRFHLVMAAGVILAGIGMLSPVPRMTDQPVPLLVNQPERWTLLLVVLAALIAFRCFRAVIEPTPYRVQTAVRQCILSLVVLDAAVCFVVQGLLGAVLVLSLLIPAMVLGQWVYST